MSPSTPRMWLFFGNAIKVCFNNSSICGARAATASRCWFPKVSCQPRTWKKTWKKTTWQPTANNKKTTFFSAGDVNQQQTKHFSVGMWASASSSISKRMVLPEWPARMPQAKTEDSTPLALKNSGHGIFPAELYKYIILYYCNVFFDVF